MANVQSALDSFLIFIEPIKNIVLKCTNVFGLKMYKENWKDLASEELHAYFGLCIFAGVFRSNHEALYELWDDTWGRQVFRAVMPLKRFREIARCLHFDLHDTRTERRQRNKLAPIQEVFEKWNHNLAKVYTPGYNVTVDEQIVPFNGRCPFKQYNPSKPSPYGIKIWALCDSESAYVWNTQVCTGKPPNAKPDKNQGKRIVMELSDGLKNRMITVDNFFSSYDLIIELKK